MNRELKEWSKEVYSDEEINELAAWMQDLTIAQIAFLKESYTAMLQAQAKEVGQAYVH